MRILQLNFEKGWRGGERQTLYCMQAFRRAGHAVELLTRAGGQMAERARAEGFAVHEVRRAPAQLAWLARHGRRYDIIHAQTANTLTWAVLAKPLHRAKVAFSRRTSFTVRPGEQWKTGWKWRHADLIVAVSDMAAGEPRRLGLAPVVIRSAVEPRAIDQANVQALVAEFGLQGKRVLATSAALIQDKDPLTLIRAVALLAGQRQDFVFLHFGGGGNREQAARELVAASGLQQVYHLAGFRRGVEDFYSIMDVFVMASEEEALGSSVLDAFLLRVPVVSTDAGGLRESVGEGRGCLVPVGDHQALAAGMARMLDDAAYRAQAVEKAYAYVRSEHDVTQMGRRYLAQFERLLGQ
ncbi:glycosyltransferase family 4 protein [Orrella sp. JC864]|uniref:glycosyltransferase family 4 protein n=1 Tax=Orrella sp. JC864 TaxID=3120298 RepID=UPI003009B0A7